MIDFVLLLSSNNLKRLLIYSICFIPALYWRVLLYTSQIRTIFAIFCDLTD